MVGALEALGVQVEADWAAGTAVVHGCAGRFPVEGAELFLGNAGTAMRCSRDAALAACMQTHVFARTLQSARSHRQGLTNGHAGDDTGSSTMSLPLQAAVRGGGSGRPWAIRAGRRRPHAGAADCRPGGRAEAAGRRRHLHSRHWLPSSSCQRQRPAFWHGAFHGMIILVLTMLHKKKKSEQTMG